MEVVCILCFLRVAAQAAIRVPELSSAEQKAAWECVSGGKNNPGVEMSGKRGIFSLHETWLLTKLCNKATSSGSRADWLGRKGGDYC